MYRKYLLSFIFIIPLVDEMNVCWEKHLWITHRCILQLWKSEVILFNSFFLHLFYGFLFSQRYYTYTQHRKFYENRRQCCHEFLVFYCFSSHATSQIFFLSICFIIDHPNQLLKQILGYTGFSMERYCREIK